MLLKEKVELPDFKMPKLTKKENAVKKVIAAEESAPPVLNL